MIFFRFFLALLFAVSLFSAEPADLSKHNLGSYAIITMRSKNPEDHVFYASEAIKMQARSNQSPPNLLQLSQVYIMADDLPAAKETLQATLKADPHFHAASLQLAYVYLWQDDLQKSARLFIQINRSYPCNELAVDGMKTIAKIWAYDPLMKTRAIPIYETLIKCNPRDDLMRYQLAVLYGWADRWDESERVVLDLLDEHPGHTDAALQLARVYRNRRDFASARKILMKHYNTSQAREQLGFIELAEADYRKAITTFEDVLKKDPARTESQRGLGAAHKNLHHYRKAQGIFEPLMPKVPEYEDLFYNYLFDTKHHTQPSLILDTRYTEVKETDFFTKQPAVSYWYWNNFATLLYPPTDRLTLKFTPFYGQEKQNSSLDKTIINYNVRKISGGAEAEYLHGDYMTLRGGTRLKRGQQIGSTLFPFEKVTLFEPWYSFRFSPPEHVIGTTGYFDSYVIRNLASRSAVRPSQFLTSKDILGYYEYRPEVALRPYLGTIVSNTYYNVRPTNKRVMRSLYGSAALPNLENHVRVSYLFEWSSFDRTSPNYLSYRRRYIHDLGASFRWDWTYLTRFFFRYDHIWEKTVDQSQQLNSDAAFIRLAKIHANRFEVELTHQVKDRLQLIIGGNYYRSNFRVRTFTTHLGMWWQF